MVLASCQQLPGSDGDDDGLIEALERAGVHAMWLPWDDRGIGAADAVILRATWDYPERLGEFLDWTKSVHRLINPAQMVRWNCDKSYLLDLERAGIPIVPTAVFAPGDPVTIPDGEVVVKPAVAGGSRGAARFTESTDALAHSAALHRDDHRVLVQPFDPLITAGETALVYLAAQRSHAFTKGPMLPEPGETGELDDSGLYLVEKLTPATPPESFWALGDAVIAAAARIVGIAPSDLLYARVDLVGTAESGPKLLEFEAIEPSLGWRQIDAADRVEAMDRFAAATAAALARG